MDLPADELEQARGYIDKVRWQYAKTMPDWPHDYAIKAWRRELTSEFEAFCRLIQQQGHVEPWPPPPATAIHLNCYLVIDVYKYWGMGPLGDRDAPERRTVINRTTLG